jgi:hypothetical protein
MICDESDTLTLSTQTYDASNGIKERVVLGFICSKSNPVDCSCRSKKPNNFTNIIASMFQKKILRNEKNSHITCFTE